MTGKTVATSGWICVYPTKHSFRDNGKTTRAVTLVNKKIPTDSWTQIEVDSTDIVAIKIKGEGSTINIYNIYNDGDNDNSIRAMQKHMRDRDGVREAGEEADIWLGDFNRHHPMWESEANDRLMSRQELDKAEHLLQLIGAHDMEMVLPKGIPTIRNSHGNRTRPDNVFTTGRIENWVTECKVLEDHTPPNADHFPIKTEILLPAQRNEEQRKKNFRATDWEKFNEVLEGKLATLRQPKELETGREIDNALERVEKAIMETMEEVVPERNTTSYSKRWWTKELEEARKEARRTAGKARRRREDRGHPIHEEARKARNKFSNMLSKTKKQHWEDWIGNLDSKTMWDAHKYMKAPPTDGGRTRIPALEITTADGTKRKIQDNDGKSKLFHEAFFYNPPENSNVDPDYQYPEPAFRFQNVTQNQIIRVAKQLNPYKAPGLNEIPNAVLTHCIDKLAPHLGPIFRASLEIGHYPQKWKKYTTIVLRKGGKTSYKEASAYRPIALLDVIAKLLAACVKEILEYHVERLQLLPKRQFGGRPGCTTTDSLHLLMKFTKDAWRKGEEVVALFLDVKGAFPNTVIPCLIHDMRRCGIPKKYTDWMSNKMTGRETVICFDDYQSDPIPINNGLDQGCNLSMFAYRCYNATQITASTGRKDELATNYADDAICATRAKTLPEAAQKMETLFHREGGPLEWAKSHFSNYEYKKFAYMTLTRKRIQDPQNRKKKIAQKPPRLKLDGKDIKATDEYKFLGVVIDKELRFKKHALHALEKGTKIINQIRRLSKTTSGMKGELARRMYYSSIAPSMLYAADVWCAPGPMKNGRRPRGMDTAIAKLQTVMRKAALQATGALRTTPSDLLFMHAEMTPLKEQIKQICQRAALRMGTLPDIHPLHQEIQNARQRHPKKHPSPLHAVMHISKLTTKKLENIEIRHKSPNWKPTITPTIATTRENGKKADKMDDSDIRIYTDGSGIGGKIGAAAILQYGFRQTKVARHHLGSDTHHTVFEGECIGQLLGLNLLDECLAQTRRRNITASIAVDNQASLQRHSQRENRPGAYIINETQKTYKMIKKKYVGLQIKFRWVPGHEGIEGSERVDGEAKRAAEGPDKNIGNKKGILKGQLPASKTAIKQELNHRHKAKMAREYKDSPRYQRMKKLEETATGGGFRKLCKTLDLNRNQVSILVQLRTEHAPLEAYLQRFQKVDQATCQQCGDEPETVTHYIRYCRAYKRHRTKLRRAIGREHLIDKTLLGKKETIKHILNYITDTRRFEKTHGKLNTMKTRTQQDEDDMERREWE